MAAYNNNTCDYTHTPTPTHVYVSIKRNYSQSFINIIRDARFENKKSSVFGRNDKHMTPGQRAQIGQSQIMAS